MMQAWGWISLKVDLTIFPQALKNNWTSIYQGLNNALFSLNIQ